MPFECPSASFNSLSGFGSLGQFVNVGQGQNNYYVKGTKFLWTSPQTDFGFGWSTDPGKDARAALAAALAANGYTVKVIYGERGGPLEVSGSQNSDRRVANDINWQITNAAKAAGFYLLSPILFNVETPESNWQVGTPGAVTVWGDQAPVATQNIFEELGVNLTGDDSFIGGTIKNLAIYAGVGLLIFALISRK